MTEKPIHLFEPVFAVEECLAEIEKVLRSGWTAPGDLTLEFEAAWCKYTGLPHAHFVSSATAGLHLAVKILADWHRLDDAPRAEREVITTPLTFVSTNHAILYEGMKPRFADIDESLCLDPESLATRITDRTRAVMFVGMGGNSGELEEVERLCDVRALPLIVDAAHMAGTRVSGDHVGRNADASVFSFQSVKNLPVGDGGMVCFRDPDNDRRARELSWLGINKTTHARANDANTGYRWQYQVPHVGFKYQGNAIAAAIGIVGLRHLDQHNAYRRQLATWYDELLPLTVTRVAHHRTCESSRHLYQVRVKERTRVIAALNLRKIYPGVHYIDNRYYPMYEDARDPCPHALTASAELLSLPLHLKMTREDVGRVAGALYEILS